MMKVSDPIIFGHIVKAYYAQLWQKHGDMLSLIGVDVNHGFGDVVSRINQLPDSEKEPILETIDAIYNDGPDLAMVDSDQGITNLHVPSDVIIDASMPAMIRNGGKMWDRHGKTRDTKAVIPDSSYAAVYQATITDCIKHGAYDPATMGSVSNVGLMAQKAEEYGSHDKTFEIATNGVVEVINSSGEVLMKHQVEKGDMAYVHRQGSSSSRLGKVSHR